MFNEVIKKAAGTSLYNNAFYLMLNTASTSALGFIFWYIMAHVFSHREVGIGTALVSVSGLIATLSSLGLGVGLIRFVSEAGEDASLLNNSVLTISIIIAAICSLIYLLGASLWATAFEFIKEDAWLTCIFIIFTVATAVSLLLDQSFIAGRAARYLFWKNTLASILKLPLPVLLFGFLGGYGIFAGTGTATLLTVMLSLFVFMPQIYSGYCPKPGLAHNLIRRVLPFSLSNYLANILSSAPTYIFPLLVLNVLGPEENAFFYMAWVIAMVLTVIPSSFAQSLFAEGSHDPGKLGSHGRRALLLSLLLLLPAILVMIVLGRWILHWFGAAYAENGIGVFRYLVWSMLPACLNSFFITVNQVKKRVALIILQTGFVSFASLGLGYWLLKTVGLSGLGMAYAIANTALALVIAWPLWNEFRTGVTQAGGLG